MRTSRRDCFRLLAAGAGAIALASTPLGALLASPATRRSKDLTIKDLRITPIALPDPPLLSSFGCHGPYFLRTIVEVVTTDGITGVGETREGAGEELRKLAKSLIGRSALAYRTFKMSDHAFAAVEVACLDAIGKASGLRLCDLLGGPVHEVPEFAAYLFYRYAADHPTLLDDKRIVDSRGSGNTALDPWGEVRTPEAMAELAFRFHQKFGFRVHKLKAGVLTPDLELETLRAMNDRFGGKQKLRIDPNGSWSVDTAVRIGEQMKDLPLEYYEDPVPGQERMAEVRRRTGLTMSTNSCVTSFEHVAQAVKTHPVDVVLADHHYWGGVTGCIALGGVARGLGWTLSQHSNNHAGVSMAAMINVGALIPELTLASDTHYPWLPEGSDVIAGPNLPIVNGRMKIPSGPGLGVELDRDKLARARETYEKSGMRGRDDVETMRMLEPNWKRPSF